MDDRELLELWGLYCRPAIARTMRAVGLDAVYERAEGDYLWRRQGDELVPVLDLVGGYGANLFGHYHPDLVAEERRLADARVPFLAQASVRGGAARLAKALAERVGDYVTIFTNSGAETVEAALKHAHLETGKLTFWAVKNAFHGKTLGAVQLTWSYREPYEDWGPKVRFLDPDDPADWEAAAAEADDLAAVFLEPILGEGGVRPLPQPFADWVGAFCRERDVPLIVDEIQSGMGRTGSFLASEALGIDPDYVLLSKGLGGGMVKIGALMIRRSRFVEEFSITHTSTFAEDDRSCLVSLKALEVLERDGLPARCAAVGARLAEKLEALRARFPEQIKEVRGHGLMVGVELHDQIDSPSNTLRMLSDQKYLGYAVSAYLLNVHRIRIVPTLSQPRTLRVQPSAYIAEAELDRFVRALEQACEALRCADVSHLLGFGVGLTPNGVSDYSAPRPLKRERPRIAKRVAFIGHLVAPEHAYHWDPSLEPFGVEQVERQIYKTARVIGPSIYDQVHVRSETGEEVHFSFIGLYLTSAQFAEALEARDTDWIMEKVEAAVELARDEGCQVIGLGGYSSIIARNGKRIRTPGIAVTTGNSLTVGMGLLALKRACEDTGIDPAQSTLAVVGANGNIASTYAMMMAGEVAELMLVVRDPSSPRTRAQVEAIRNYAPGAKVTVTADLADLRHCQLILSASNAAGSIIFPEHLSPDPVVVCDISLPADVDPSVELVRPDVKVIQGGVVRLPYNDDLRFGGQPLEPGFIYACTAETILMGLEGIREHGSYGAVTPEGVHRFLAVAEKHGFRLGQVQTAQGHWR
ncbi:MAG TPA: aminotransferase class III-fold pyridoxal phosphate-dependent enzyme [Longimicrobiaceae bacterium]|nr:aminotransferase class III-fold pyridoxal phosphate-dependent enzyme [Longimicrobiaceae bacterium]